MATKQIKDYSAKTAFDSTDQFLIQESGGTTKKATTAELGTISGWIPAGETWTYASADDPTYTFTITGDYTTRYSVGMKIKLTQTTVKYFIITAISYSSPNTTVTVYGGTDYDLANAAIALPYYSMVKAPYGFPMTPVKWTFTATGGSVYKDNPNAGTYYGTNSDPWTSGSNIAMSCPIGNWDINFKTQIAGDKASSVLDGACQLYDGSQILYNYQAAYYVFNTYLEISATYNTATKTTHYVLMKTDTASVSRITIYNYTVRYICAYL